ncbi:retropepsin-like aspartic protease family protein [Almyronema epifaneia]|uniref:Retroviral-like aspartic protease family protein n=1 Tax=Almyronema epifaneia S1 TaxID=2991925 RepID=A0ABW6IES6_9CYAN
MRGFLFTPASSLALLLSSLALVGCRPSQRLAVEAIAPRLKLTAAIATVAVGTLNLKETAATQSVAYTQALDYAASALSLSQNAYSADDWQLVVNYWQQAVDLLETLSANAVEAATIQSNLSLYRQNLGYAQRQRDRFLEPTAIASPALSTRQPEPTAPAATPPNRETTAASPATSEPAGGKSDRHSVPIVRRLGRTPVVSVSFNQSRHYDMVVDTGASGTLITQKMATDLGITPIGQARITTASATDVVFPVGYVPSLQVGDILAQNVLVAIAGPEQTVGLLGHDIFGDYDVTIRQEVIEFQAR